MTITYQEITPDAITWTEMTPGAIETFKATLATLVAQPVTYEPEIGFVTTPTVPPTPLQEAEAVILREKLTTLVVGLGAHETPDGLAAFLRNEGITGARSDSSACPLARYLSRELGGIRIRVSCGSVSVKDPRFGRIRVSLSPMLCEFYGRFDSGFYPSLVEPSVYPIFALA